MKGLRVLGYSCGSKSNVVRRETWLQEIKESAGFESKSALSFFGVRIGVRCEFNEHL